MQQHKYRWLITTGDLGSLDNYFVEYTLHPNGKRALYRAIQDFANQTGRECWAEIPSEPRGRNRYYPARPNN